jgi:MFS family permease
MRIRMSESPLFEELRSSGRVSRNPIRESFGNPLNLRYVLVALFGATAGQGVVWYTGQFYALTFLQRPLNLDWRLSYILVSIALALGTPFFIVFGRLSDRIGRKPIMLAGCLLGAVCYVPIYMAMKAVVNPSMAESVPSLPVLNQAALVALLFVQMLFVTMVYGPIAAFLVELFPTSIRYTSMSLPYHLGNEWFGGFLPLIATAATTSVWARELLGGGAIYAGLIYPIAICLMTLVVGGLYIRETRDHKIDTPIPRVSPSP